MNDRTPADPDSAPEHGAGFRVDLEKGETPPKGFVRGRTVVLVCSALVIGLLGLNVASTVAGNRRDARMSADRAVLASAQVRYSVQQTPEGIVERWIADPADDAVEGSIRRAIDELLLVRRNVGDFRIGTKKGVPGREDLESNLAKLRFVRTEVANGVQLEITTDDAELLTSLHAWSKELKE
jgi:hypothetical protein